MGFIIPDYTSALAFPGEAVQDSTDLAIMAAASAGNFVVSGLTVTPQSTPNMTVAVGGGVIVAANGFPISVAAVSSLAVAAATSTDRRDLVVVSKTAVVSVIKGTACGTAGWAPGSTGQPPVKPALPPTAVALREVYVGASTTSITGANLIDKRMFGTQPRVFPSTVPGPPTSGTYPTGAQWLDSTERLWICTLGGTPGTWASTGPPPGDIKMTAAATAPGWLTCYGQAISRATYAPLFAAIGTAYGAGNGSTTFNVPDLRGRVPVGTGAGVGLTTRPMGAAGGSEDLQQHNHGNTGTESGVHTHNTTANGDSATPALYATGSGGDVLSTATGTFRVFYAAGETTGNNNQGHVHGTATAGAGNAQNMPPFLVVRYVIKT